MCRTFVGHPGARLHVFVLALPSLLALLPLDVLAAPKKQVLLLTSSSGKHQPHDEFVRRFTTALVTREDMSIELREFCLEVDLSDESPEVSAAARGYLATLYGEHMPDLVVGIGAPARRFLSRSGASLFPGVPLLTTLVERLYGAQVPVSDREVALEFSLDPLQVISFVRAALPDTRAVTVVLGEAENEKVLRNILRQVLPARMPDLEFHVTEGQTASALEARLSALPPGHAVVYASFARDSEGNVHGYDKVLPRLVAASAAPVLAIHRDKLGTGVLGVVTWSMDDVTGESVRMAEALLNGAAATDLRRPPLLQLERLVDARQMKRWGVPESRLPPGTVVIHEPSPSWYPFALAASGVVILQSMLIVALLVQRSRRMKAEAEARRLAQAVIRAQELERARIARELHDDMVQRVGQLGILAAREVPEGEGRRAIVQALTDLGGGLKEVAYSLHPSSLQKQGLAECLSAECSRFQELSGVRVVLEKQGLAGDVDLGLDRALCAYRVVQESMRNARRHGAPSNIRVHASLQDGGLQLAIADDGRGFDPGSVQDAGLGLLSMKERVSELGGELDIQSSPGKGTDIVAWIPLHDVTSRERTA